MFYSRGFSLLELLLVIAILAILATLGFGFFRGFTKNVELDSTAKTIVSDLRDARGKAMSGEDSRKWGIRFINASDDYYEFFSTPTDYSDASKSVKNTAYLARGVSFSSPSEGQNSDVIFGKITGTSTAAAIIIVSESRSKTINITASGNIY